MSMASRTTSARPWSREYTGNSRQQAIGTGEQSDASADADAAALAAAAAALAAAPGMAVQVDPGLTPY